MIGGLVQTLANGSLGAVYAGRVIAGIGVGGLTTLGQYLNETLRFDQR
jgi:hypothetical protein